MTDSQKISTISKWLGSGSINIFGLPLAGKDDQTGRLAKIFDGTKLGGGDILRASITPEIKSYLDSGELIPSKLYVKLVLPYLSQPDLEGKPLLLSSVGRWYGEQDGVMQVLNDANHTLKAVVHLVIDKDTALDRLETSRKIGDRGERDDDYEHLLVTRFEEFEAKTKPVIDHYKELGLLIEIDATKSRDEIQSAILDKLYERATQ